MSHKLMNCLYRTVVRAEKKRDQIEIQAINRLLAPFEPHRGRGGQDTNRRPAAKRPRPRRRR